MAGQMAVLAVGLLGGLLVLLGVCALGYLLCRRTPKSPYQNLIPTLPLFPACTAPVRQVSQACWPRSDQIPFAVPPRFEHRRSGGLPGEGPAKSPGAEPGAGQRDARAHRGSLCIQSWYPVGTLLEGLYRGPALDQAVAPPPPGGPAPPRLCFAVEYGCSSEQLTVSLLRLSGLPPRLHGNATLLELRLLPSQRRPRRASARGAGPDPEVNQSVIFQVSAVCVSESTLSVCVLSGGGSGRARGVVGRVLYPLGGPVGAWGRVLWRDLETDAPPQCSELGDVQVSLAYSPSLRRLTLGVLRGRGLQLTRDAEVWVQVSLQRLCQVVKTRCGAQVRCEGAEPHLNHRVTFKLRPQHLDQSCVRVELWQRDPVTPGCGALLGEVVLGPFMYARGPALQHWTDMLSTKQGPPVTEWHGLGRGP